MLKIGEVYFNNKTSFELNLYLENYPSMPRINENFERVPVIGKSGDVFINYGTYPNIEITFEFTILNENIQLNYELIENWLINVEDNRLFFGPYDKCYRVKKVIMGDLKQEFLTIGTSDITFICEPFKTDSAEKKYNITQTGFSFYYPGTIEGEPLLKVTGSGNIQVIVNNNVMQINNVSSYVEIDSKLMQVRNSNGTSKDGDTLGDFPVFIYGKNIIEFTGSITNIEVSFITRYR